MKKAFLLTGGYFLFGVLGILAGWMFPTHWTIGLWLFIAALALWFACLNYGLSTNTGTEHG